MKPLVLDGSIYFFSKSHLRWSSVQDVTTRLTESRRDAWKGTRLRKLKGEQRRAEIELVLNDIVGNIPPLRNRTGSPIALNTVEERAYQLALNGVQTSGGRAAALARLGQWGLPKFKSSPSSLVRLRGSDLFQQWRLTLALALNAAGDVPDDRDGAKQARAILTGELEAASARVRKEANSSLALGGIKFGWKGFAIGALTSAPSGLMEADPVAGTALAGAMGAAGGLIEGYVTAAHLRAESRAVWDIVSSFRDLDRDGV
ncbi:hypothetical protein [Leifsonia xyli]|uniref:hypothetical protein n=1 Tax=Leifsonia xyli TaxID=1575 RepID=UPI003D67D41F